MAKRAFSVVGFLFSDSLLDQIERVPSIAEVTRQGAEEKGSNITTSNEVRHLNLIHFNCLLMLHP